METDSAKRFWAVMVPVCFGSFLSTLSSTMIYVALPVLTESMQTSLTTIQWAITGFLLATGIAAPIVGFLCDRFGSKRVYVYSLAGFIVSSALCALSWNIYPFIAFRVLQGFCSGLILPVTMTIIYQIIPRNKQPMGVSLWGSSTLLAPAIGPIVSGLLVQFVNWQWIFLIHLPIGITALLLVVRLIPHDRMQLSKRIDTIGLMLVTLSSLALLIAFSEAHHFGWLSRETVTLIAAGTAGLIAFVRRALKMEEPLLDFRVFRLRQFSLSLAVLSMISLALYAGIYLTPIFLQNVQQMSPATTGLILLPISLAMAAAMPFIGSIYNKVGPYRIMIPSALLICVGTYAMGNLAVTAGAAFVIGWMTVRNVGIAVMNGAATSVGMEAVPRELAGHASAISNWVRQLVSALSIGFFTSMMQYRSTVREQAMLHGQSGDHVFQQVGTVTQQALTLAINELFLWTALISFLTIPIVRFMKR